MLGPCNNRTIAQRAARRKAGESAEIEAYEALFSKIFDHAWEQFFNFRPNRQSRQDQSGRPESRKTRLTSPTRPVEDGGFGLPNYKKNDAASQNDAANTGNRKNEAARSIAASFLTTHVICSRSHFIIFAIAVQSLAQSRHDLAHAAIVLSSGNFSQAAAHSSQHLAQQSAAGPQRAL